MIVFLLSGIWHGAAWTYIIWGVLHGAYQIIGNLTAKPRSRLLEKMKLSEDGALVKSVRCVITFILVSLAWLIFRANSLPDMLVLFKELFTGWGGVNIVESLNTLGLSLRSIITIILSVIILKLLDLQISTKMAEDSENTAISGTRVAVYLTITWCVAIAWMILLLSNVDSAFIYFQF
jgi:hypothetical protein